MPPLIPSGPASARPSAPTDGGSSASVLEFTCLFTHDLRRKQKRWEDGRLKYHTFNKRVMVYDERGNFVGDMHWQRDWDFDEGEELQLERGAAIIQVVECVGRQEQDLTELLDKRAKEKEQRQARASLRPPLSAASPNTPSAGTGTSEHFQTRHRPLNHLLGTPTGHHGRAVVPTESPFELRQKVHENPNDRSDSRPSKRRKCDRTPPSKLGYAQNLFGATLSLSAVPLSSAPPPRPTGPTCRAQPETSSSQEDVMADARPLGERRGLSRRNSLHAGASRAGLVSASSITSVERDRSTVLEDQKTTENTTRTLGRPRPEKAISGFQLSVKRSADASRHHSTSFGDGGPPTLAAKPKATLTKAGTEIETLAQDFQSAAGMNRSERHHDTRGIVVPNLGASRSQAIVLDGHQGSQLDAQCQLSKRQEASSAKCSSRGASVTAKQTHTKRNKMVQSETQPAAVNSRRNVTRAEDIEVLAQEERIELRLKPRQRRGLLLLSEKRRKTKQAKRQDVPASELHLGGEHSGKSTEAAGAKSSFTLGAEIAAPCPAAQQDGPFTPSPDAAAAAAAGGGNSTPEPPSLSPQPDWGQTALRIDEGIRSETMDVVGPNATTDLSEHQGRLVGSSEPPKSPGPINDDPGNAKDTVNVLSPSPRGRRMRPGRGGPAKISKEPSETSSLEMEELVADADSGRTLSRPSRQARKTKSLVDQDSTRSKKKMRTVNSGGSDSEEPPQAPVHPHLARLSRKSVRSREVIGFVPSNPLVVNPTTLLQPSGNARVSGLSRDDAAAAACLADPTGVMFLMPNDTRPCRAQVQVPLSPIAISLAATSDCLPVDGEGSEGTIEESSGGRAAPLTMLQSDDSRKRRSLPCDTSAVLGLGSEVDKNTTMAVYVPGSDSIVASEKGTGRKTTEPQTAIQERLEAEVDSSTMRPQSHNHPLNLPGQPGRPMNGASYIGTGSCVTEVANRHTPAADTTRPPRTRIANPATRGRKAALKSDAAGQVPLSIIPVDPPPARVGMRPPAMPRPDSAASERPKRKMKFPGFTSAKGGGPWSREAHDLLESARPC